MAPEVTAVIPTLGRHALRRAVESVDAQTKPVDCVVVLDQPSQRSAVESALSGLSHRLVVSDGWEGPAAARNLGVGLVETEFVAFLDDDDVWVPRKTERQILSLRESGKGAFAVSGAHFHRRGSVARVPEVPYQGEGVANYIARRRRLRYGSTFMQTSTLMVSVDTARRYPWDASLRIHEDWDLFIRLEASGLQCVQLLEPLVHVFQESDRSLSKSPSWQRSLDWLSKHASEIDADARADFLAVHVLRPALAEREWRTSRTVVRELLGTKPAAAALTVGFAGLLRK